MTTQQQHQLDSNSLHIKGRNDDSNIFQIMEKPGYLSHKFPFRSCYTHLKHDGSEEISTCHDRGSSNVDYIFYSDSNTNNGDVLSLCGVLGLLNANEVDRMNKLPNRQLSSDHLLLQASFVLEKH